MPNDLRDREFDGDEYQVPISSIPTIGDILQIDGDYGLVEAVYEEDGLFIWYNDSAIDPNPSAEYDSDAGRPYPNIDAPTSGDIIQIDDDFVIVDSVSDDYARVEFGALEDHQTAKGPPSGTSESVTPSVNRNEGSELAVPDTIPVGPDMSITYNKLTVVDTVGKGGNADVTKATLPTADGDITLAIKEPRFSGTLSTDQVDRMLQEAKTWDRLDDHEHIVGVVDYGSKPLPWIAMEYMDGGHLGERSENMDFPQALWTAIAVTKGVRHAHRRGVAHLDLKPENILFRTVEDAWDVPKVADWGLSKHLLEHSKSVEGISMEYAAPEQFDDDYGPADDITDVYQLGAVFYELFTGRPPFEGQPFQIIEMVKDEQPTPPSEIADVPDGLDEILLTALAKEKADRYEDVIYLRDDLQKLSSDCEFSPKPRDSDNQEAENDTIHSSGRLTCSECGFTPPQDSRPLRKGFLRKGDFCPECRRGLLNKGEK